MARKSKRIHAISVEEQKEKGIKYYKAGIYARLSSDQDEKKNESVDTQVDMAKKFVEDWNKIHNDKIEIVECYTDLGKTGTDFNREAFNHLMQNVRLGEINCIIVKDLSRFGRNYLETGNYIEKIFPFLGVRFIAVSDGYDTGAEKNHTKQMASEIKNLVNDMYAKDFSKKAKQGLKLRREEGSYVGGPPPYGYTAVWEGKIRKLIPDENTAGIVRCIYEQFVKLECYKAVTDGLNRRKINPPAVYKKNGEVYSSPDVVYKGWDKGSVERILKSETYIGRLVQGKTSITARNEKNRIHNNTKEWVTTEQAHEGLIELYLFEQAAEVRRKISKNAESAKSYSDDCPLEENIFGRVLFCGVCGRKMTRRGYVKHYKTGEVERLDGYFCLNATSTKVESCPESNCISKRELENILCVVLEKEFALSLDRQKIYVERSRIYIGKRNKELEQEYRKIEHSLTALQSEESGRYMDYRTGRISQKDYVDYKMWQEEKYREVELKKQELSEQKKKLERNGETYLRAVRSLLQWKQKKNFTKELVETVIDKIYVYPGKRVEVVFLYSDAYRKEAFK